MQAPSEASVLLVIEANPNISQSEIGRMLEIAGANMAPLISRLQKRELIERQSVDGRSHGLELGEFDRDQCVQECSHQDSTSNQRNEL